MIFFFHHSGGICFGSTHDVAFSGLTTCWTRVAHPVKRDETTQLRVANKGVPSGWLIKQKMFQPSSWWFSLVFGMSS